MNKVEGNKYPTYIGGSFDDQKFLIEGVNVWDHKWIPQSRTYNVIDPVYKAKKKFLLYKIITDSKEVEFIAGEFSNSVWGFYKPTSET